MSEDKKPEDTETIEESLDECFLSSNLALYMELDTIQETAKNQMLAINEGDIAREIRNQQHTINMFYNIVKKPPLRLKGVPTEELINIEQVKQFNELVYDLIYLNDLIDNITMPRYGAFSKTSSKELKQYFIPKYEEMINKFLEPTHKRWYDYQYSHRILRQVLIRKIKALGFDLEAQKARAYTQTLPLEEIDAIKNTLGRNDGFGFE